MLPTIFFSFFFFSLPIVGGSDFYVAGKWESNLNQTSETGFGHLTERDLVVELQGGRGL